MPNGGTWFCRNAVQILALTSWQRERERERESDKLAMREREKVKEIDTLTKKKSYKK